MFRLIIALLLPVSLFAQVGTLTIQNIDVSFLPKVKMSLSFPESGENKNSIVIREDGRKIRTFRLEKDSLTYLSSAKKAGNHEVVISFAGEEVKTSYRSGRWRHLGSKSSRKVKLRATGPGYKAIPCRFIAVHESGKSFEDYTTKGGYGQLGSGFILPAGKYYTELRLAGLDLTIDHFPMLVKSDRATYVHRRFAFLGLPASDENYHIDIERVPGRYPAIHCNLARLINSLPKELPKLVLPLPEGNYSIRLTADRLVNGSPPASSAFHVELIAGRKTDFPAE